MKSKVNLRLLWVSIGIFLLVRIEDTASEVYTRNEKQPHILKKGPQQVHRLYYEITSRPTSHHCQQSSREDQRFIWARCFLEAFRKRIEHSGIFPCSAWATAPHMELWEEGQWKNPFELGVLAIGDAEFWFPGQILAGLKECVHLLCATTDLEDSPILGRT